MRIEQIGDCTLYLASCEDVLPTLGKVDAVVDKSNAVVFNDSYDKAASRKHSQESESGSSLGGQTGGYCGAVCERGYVTSSNGRQIPNYLGGFSKGNSTLEYTAEIAGKGGQQERTLQGWNSEHGLSQRDREETLQQVRGNEQFSDTSQGQCAHEQRAGEFRSPLQSVSQQPSQARMVELPKNWAIITDPPYGIGIDGQTQRIKGKKSDRKGYDYKGWDAARPDEALKLLAALDCPKIIWGGNYFADLLPAGNKWLVWDKGQRIQQSDCELAYTNMDGALRVFTLNRMALQQDGAVHPTQKPLALMQWCLNLLPQDYETIIDPFMGSGTTGVACVKMGRKFIGIEREPEYFEIACKRIREAYAQPDMFIEEVKRYQIQGALPI